MGRAESSLGSDREGHLPSGPLRTPRLWPSGTSLGLPGQPLHGGPSFLASPTPPGDAPRRKPRGLDCKLEPPPWASGATIPEVFQLGAERSGGR